MFQKNKKEIVVIGVLIILIILFVNPFYFWMPDSLEKVMLAGMIIVFGIFSNLVLKEKPQDEREKDHLMKSSRAGYLAGGITLMVIIVIQALQGEVDEWLLAALGVMVLVKFIVSLYNQKNN